MLIWSSSSSKFTSHLSLLHIFYLALFSMSVHLCACFNVCLFVGLYFFRCYMDSLTLLSIIIFIHNAKDRWDKRTYMSRIWLLTSTGRPRIHVLLLESAGTLKTVHLWDHHQHQEQVGYRPFRLYVPAQAVPPVKTERTYIWNYGYILDQGWIWWKMLFRGKFCCKFVLFLI